MKASSFQYIATYHGKFEIKKQLTEPLTVGSQLNSVMLRKFQSVLSGLF